MFKLTGVGFKRNSGTLKRPFVRTVLSSALLVLVVTAIATSLVSTALATHETAILGPNLVLNPSFENFANNWTPGPNGVWMGSTGFVSSVGTRSFGIAGVLPTDAIGMGDSSTPRPGVQTTNIIPVQPGKQYVFSAEVCRWPGFTGNQWMEITYYDSSGNPLVTPWLSPNEFVALSNCPDGNGGGWTLQTMRFNTDFANQLLSPWFPGVNITGVRLALGVSLENSDAGSTSVIFYDDVFFGALECGGLTVNSVAPTNAFVPAAPNTLFWLERFSNEEIRRANLDGMGIQGVLSANIYPATWMPHEAHGLAVDPVDQKVYWTDTGYNEGMKAPKLKHAGRIMRRNLDGTGPSETLICNVSPELINGQYYGDDFAPIKIALDLENRQMYWADLGTQTIRRANMDGNPMGSMQILVDKFDITTGTNGVQSVLGDDFRPIGVALDVAGNMIYWTDIGTGRIQRRNMNGAGPIQTLVDQHTFPTEPHPYGIALCLSCPQPKMFWSEFNAKKIMVANLDGTGITIFAEDEPGASPSASTAQPLIYKPTAVAVDEFAGVVYWTSNVRDTSMTRAKIQQRAIDGSGPIQIVVEEKAPANVIRDLVLVAIP